MITIDWGTKIIFVPKSETTLVQSSPIEIRELNVNVFRLALKELEATVAGIAELRTHIHNTEVLLGGIVYARVVEIINGYTITFEDGPYAVNVIGANSNIGDAINFNQVSVRTANAAGLISNSAIEFSSFQNAVYIDTNSSNVGTIFPSGTPQAPVNNLTDALLIAQFRAFDTLHFLSDFTFNSTVFILDFTIVGEGLQKTTLTFENGCILGFCEFFNCSMTGFIAGFIGATDCDLVNLGSIGVVPSSQTVLIIRCLIGGTLTIPSNYSGKLKSIDCYSDNPGSGAPILDLGGSNADVIIRNWSGGLELMNITNPSNLSIDLVSGAIIVGSTNTSGDIKLRGIGTLDDSSNGTIIDSNALINKENLALATAIQSGFARGSGNGVNQIQLDLDASPLNAAYDPSMIVIRRGAGAGQTRLVYEYNGNTRIATVDRDWKIAPDSTSEYAIMPNPGREHINEGLARGGTANTITLNLSASNIDNAYKYQTVFIRSGTGDDQVNLVSSYDGTTKIATMHHNWGVIPDTTSAYLMQPSHLHIGSTNEVANAVWDILTADHETANTFGKLLSDMLINSGQLQQTSNLNTELLKNKPNNP